MDEILKWIDERINELDVCLKGSNEIHERHCLRMMLGEVREMKEIILSQHKQLATDNNVVTIGDKMRECGKKLSKFIEAITNTKDTALSPEEAQELKTDRDYWKAEALKHCAKLGEIKLLVGRTSL